MPALPEIADTVGAEHLVTLKGLYIENDDGFVVLHGVVCAAPPRSRCCGRCGERVGGLRVPRPCGSC